MAYNSNIPQATDQLSVSQGQILANFQEIATAFNLNHGPFNSGLGIEGMHAFVQMPISATPLATAAGQVGLYAAQNSLTSKPELFFQRDSQLAGTGFPISATGSAVIGGNTVNYAYLPSGVIIKYGSAQTGAAGQTTINLNGVGVPAYATNFWVTTSAGINTAGPLLPANAAYGVTILNCTQPGSFIAYTFTTNTAAQLPNAFFSWYAIGI